MTYLDTIERTIKIYMMSCGVWPYQSAAISNIVRFLWALQHFSLLIPEIIMLFKSLHDMDIVIESTPTILYNVLMIMIIANLIYYQPTIKILLETSSQDFKMLSDETEIEILQRYDKEGKIFCLVCLVSVNVALLIYCSAPLLPIFMDYLQPLNESRPKSPLFRAELYIDGEKYFYSILMYSYMTSAVGAFPLIAIDFFFITQIQHICGMFAILGHRLENILKCTGKLNKNDIDEEIINSMIMHKKLLDFVNNMNTTFGFALAFIVLIATILMSFTSLVVIIKWGQINDVLRFGLFTLAEIFHLFAYSYFSQQLIDHNDNLHKSICDSEWYNASLKSKMFIKMMLLRCSKPCFIKCIIFPLSMENFTTIVKASFSYFTVVKSTL